MVRGRRRTIRWIFIDRFVLKQIEINVCKSEWLINNKTNIMQFLFHFIFFYQALLLQIIIERLCMIIIYYIIISFLSLLCVLIS